MKRKPNIVLIGRQGSGKGTQARVVSRWLDVAHFSSGDMIADEIRKGTEFGRLAQEYRNSGLYVPDGPTTNFLVARMKPGYLLEGFPRTIGQAYTLAGVNGNMDVDLFIHLDVPERTCVERVVARRVCDGCDALYGLARQPPKDDKCYDCTGKTYRREDDAPEVVERRMVEYREKTLPVVEFYRPGSSFAEIDGNRPVKDVSADLKQTIRSMTGFGLI